MDRDRLGGWLEGAGFGVIECPGPNRIDLARPGVRGRRCPLVETADLAILDVRVVSDAFREKAPSRRLLRLYLSSREPVLLIGERAGPRRSFHENGVTILRARPSRRSLVGAVQQLLKEAG